MAAERRRRSALAAAASRRNGARSRGPRSASGKAVSAQNARKHGLFSAEFAEEQALSPELAELAEFTAGLVAGRPGGALEAQLVIIAAARFAQATRLLRDLRDELSAFLADEKWDSERILAYLGQITRIGQHQRRFRGQRDRALRRLMAEPSAP